MAPKNRANAAIKERPPVPSPGTLHTMANAAPDRVAVVLGKITKKILDGEFATGITLASEGKLAVSFGVSRTVMREVMRTLRARGLIEMSQGKRPRVKAPNLEDAVIGLDLLLRRNHASLLNLVEVRRPLETEIAALAAERANDEHVRQLEQSVDELRSATDLKSRSEADAKFHRVLAEATGNPVFVLILQALAGFLSESRSRTLNYSGAERAAGEHRKILDSVQAHDSKAARMAMMEHLSHATLDLKGIQRRSR